ncbi:hypothetical protein Hanom_Chr05g00428991 [Helianthus anomalus]
MRSLFRSKQFQFSTTDHIKHLHSPSNKLGFGIRTVVTTSRVVLFSRFGSADVLEVRDDVRVPDLKPNEVLV